MRAREIMSRHVITIGTEAPVRDAINMMLSHRVSGLPVVDSSGKLTGILSQGDFIRRAEIGTEKRRGRWLSLLAGADRTALDFSRQHGRKVGEVMTPNPIVIGEDTPLEEIARLMERHNVKRFPVMSGDEIVGMVTRADFLTAIKNVSPDRYAASAPQQEIRESVVAALSQESWRPSALNVSVGDGVVTLRGSVRSENAHRAAIVAAENVTGVKEIDDQLQIVIHPPPEEDYGGGDLVSLQEEASTTDDEPL